MRLSGAAWLGLVSWFRVGGAKQAFYSPPEQLAQDSHTGRASQ